MASHEPTSQKILELSHLTVDFGGVRAVNDLSLAVASPITPADVEQASQETIAALDE